MNPSTPDFEGSIRRRTVRAIAVSAALHVLALTWFMTFGSEHNRSEGGFTEITWIDPAEAAPAPVLLPAAVETPVPVMSPPPLQPEPVSPDGPGVTPVKTDRREPVRAERASVAPLRAVAPASASSLTEYAPPLPVRGTALGEIASAPAPRGTLSRVAPAARAPAPLERSAAPSRQPVLAAVKTPDAPSVVPALAEDTGTAATRSLAGATLIGPVAGRTLLSYEKPVYPEWAKHEAVETSVTITFRVLADGRVKEDAQLQRTSGYEDFDRNALSALRTWRFAPLDRGMVGEQWGTVTFTFRLTDSFAR